MPETPLTDAIVALTTYANTVTGESDTTLSAAVETLIDGYGGGGSPELIYNWDFTQSLTDTVQGRAVTLTNCTQDSSGVHFAAANAYINFSSMANPNSLVTYEIDISSASRQGTAHGRFFSTNQSGNGIVYRSTGNWAAYFGTWQESAVTDANYFSGHTMKVVYSDTGVLSLYRDNTLILQSTADPQPGPWWIGSNGQSFYNVDITALRVYKGDTTK